VAFGLESPNNPIERGFDVFHGFLGDMMDNGVDHPRAGDNYMRQKAETSQECGLHRTF